MCPTTSQAGIGTLRPAPVGMPEVGLAPPVVAESGDPFTAVRVTVLLARIERGRAIPLRAIVDRLNATHLDWLFPARVVADVVLQLQANWMADYRSTQGIVIDEGPSGAAITIEDSSRVDPWIVGQVERQVAACRDVLLEFSRRDRSTGE